MSEFKIMHSGKIPCSVSRVPMWYAQQFNEQAVRNHNQTIERLNERGGLCPVEFYLIAHGLKSSSWENIKTEEAIKWLENEFSLIAQISKLKAENEKLKAIFEAVRNLDQFSVKEAIEAICVKLQKARIEYEQLEHGKKE